jgi:hypothetical protein
MSIVTMGPEGALVAERLESGEITVGKVEAPKVQAVDTTVCFFNAKTEVNCRAQVTASAALLSTSSLSIPN